MCYWPEGGADPLIGEPALLTPAVSSQPLISFHLQSGKDKYNSWCSYKQILLLLGQLSPNEPEKGMKACLMLTENAGPCSAGPRAAAAVTDRLFFLQPQQCSFTQQFLF